MATYTNSLRLVLPATGEYPGTWGVQANNGLTSLVDTSVAGTATITMTAADYTLSTANGASDEARAAILNVDGTPGAARNIIVPAVSKLYVVYNNTTGGFAQTVKTSAGTGVSVPNGATAYLRCDGTNVVAAVNYLGSLSLGTALSTSFGGTGSTSTTYCSLTSNVNGILPPSNGGTGVANNAANTITFSGAFGVTFTLTNTTAITLPTSGTLATLAGTETFTNKRITQRVNSIADAATITPTGDSSDQYNVTALAQSATIAAPSGTPTSGQKLILRIKDNGTGRALTWTTTSGAYRAVGVTLPTTTTANKTSYIGCIYNSDATFWDVVAVTTEA